MPLPLSYNPKPHPFAAPLSCTVPRSRWSEDRGHRGPNTVPSAKRVWRALPLPAVTAAKGSEAVASGGEWLAEWPPVPTLATRPVYPSITGRACAAGWSCRNAMKRPPGYQRKRVAVKLREYLVNIM